MQGHIQYVLGHALNVVRHTLYAGEESMPHNEMTVPQSAKTMPENEKTLPQDKKTMPGCEKTLPQSEVNMPQVERGMPSDVLILWLIVSELLLEETIPALIIQNMPDIKTQFNRNVNCKSKTVVRFTFASYVSAKFLCKEFINNSFYRAYL